MCRQTVPFRSADGWSKRDWVKRDPECESCVICFELLKKR